MCGRYATFTRLDEQPGLFDLDFISEEVTARPASWNVAPTTAVPIIVERYEEQRIVREAHLAHWGLLPPWAHDKSFASKMINARSETVFEKRSFAPSARKKRCLVPADGYFEWKKVGSGKQPYYITRADGQPLAFAGLYSWWKDSDGWLLTTTIMTKAADQLADLHHRLPCILNPEDFAAWLDVELTDEVTIQAILNQRGPELVAVPVDPAVGKVSHNEASNILPIADEDVLG